MYEFLPLGVYIAKLAQLITRMYNHLKTYLTAYRTASHPLAGTAEGEGGWTTGVATQRVLGLAVAWARYPLTTPQWGVTNWGEECLERPCPSNSPHPSNSAQGSPRLSPQGTPFYPLPPSFISSRNPIFPNDPNTTTVHVAQ